MRRTVRHTSTLYCLSALIGGGWGTLRATRAEPPRIAVQLVQAADVVEGELVSLTASELRLQSADAGLRVMPVPELRSLTPLASKAEDSRSIRAGPEHRVLLSHGDELAAEAVGIADDSLTVRRRAGDVESTTAIPLEFVRAVLLRGDSPETDRRVLRQVLRDTFRNDTLLLRSGDRWEGEILGWDDSGCRLRTPAGEQVFATVALAAVVLDPALQMLPPPSPAGAVVLLADGSRLSAARVVQAEAEWRIVSSVAVELRAPLDAVQRIDFFGPAVQSLSAIAPTEFEQRPFLSRPSGFERDRNVECGPLRIGNTACGWGLGVSSGARLAWTLPPGFSRFETRVGIDAAAGEGGSVDFVVRVDGVEQARSGPRTGRDPPLDLGPIALSGATRLELVTEYAGGGDVLDYADWGRPTLLR